MMPTRVSRAVLDARRETRDIDRALAALSLASMKPQRHRSKVNPIIERLAREGRVRPGTLDISDALTRRGPMRGPITNAGSRAVQEQRGERG